MQKLKPSLLFAPLALLALLAPAPTPAQEAPKPEVKEEAKPVLLTEDEIKLWQAWIRGDLEASYALAQDSLAAGPASEPDFDVSVGLMTRAAHELGWQAACATDLQNVIPLYADDRSVSRLRWHLIEMFKCMGRVSDAAELASSLGFIKDWWLCGPFANDRGQGFEDVLALEQSLAPAEAYDGKEGQKVSLRRVPVSPLDGTVDIGSMVRPREEAVAFLVCAVHVDEIVKESVIRFGSDGPVKVGVMAPLGAELPDSQRVHYFATHDQERDVGFDQSAAFLQNWSCPGKIFKGGLLPGWNVLVFKCGVSDGPWRVRARFVEQTGLTFASSEEQFIEALGSSLPFSERGGTTGKGGFAKEAPVRWLYEWAAAELLAPTADRTSTQTRTRLDKVLAHIAEQAGDSPNIAELSIVNFLAAWANRSSASVAAGREENRRRELLKQCLELDPKAARAALELSQYYTTTFANPALADEYAQQAVKLRPDWTEARIYASRVVAMKGLDIEVERELAKLLQENPEDANVLRFSAYYAGLRRDYKLSNELFERALKADFSDAYSRARLLERAAARNDLPAALKLAKETRQLDPFDTEAAAILADLFLYDGKYSLAERELNNALEICPRDDTLLEKLGRVYSAWADAEPDKPEYRAKALEAYQAALDANPKREDIERYLEFLEGGQPPFEAALQEDLRYRIAAQIEEPVDPDNPYEVVYHDEITVVNEDGTTARYIQQAYRVLNDQGRDWLQRLDVPAYSGQQGRCVEAQVWRPAGIIEQGRRSRFSASFPPLEIGDIVHVRFRVTDSEQSFFGDFYGTRETFSDYVPVLEVRYVWVLPKGRTFYEYRTGNAPEKTVAEVNGHTVWSYRAKDLPKLHDEPLAPEIHQRSATVQVSSYANWKDFGRWYYNLIRKQMEPTPEMTAKVAALTQGLATEKDKARAIYNWVVTDVRYNADWHFGVHGYKPFSAGAVFARCIGDCKDKAILMCTMLKIAGVTAWPVILNLDNFRGEEDITLPMPDHFNHAIACIEYSDGSRQFVDGTTTYNGIDELSSADRGANVIIVRPEGGERAQIPWGAPEDDSEHDDIDAELAGNGTLKLKVTRTARGDSAASLRMQFEREGDRKRQLEQEWSEFYPGARVSGIDANDLSNIDLPPVIKYTVELPGAYTSQNGEIAFKTALNPREWTQTEFAGLTARKTDLLTPAPYMRSSEVRLTLPAGHSVAAKPADLKIEHTHARLELSVAVKDGVLTVKRSYALLGGVVKPADYPEFRRKLSEFDTAETAAIKLKR